MKRISAKEWALGIAAFLLFIILITSLTSCKSKRKSLCSDYKDPSGWFIVYNKFRNKYAVMQLDTMYFDGPGSYFNVMKWYLVKNGYGEVRMYGEKWQKCHGIPGCGDPDKSFFSNSCDAKEFLLTHLRSLKDDHFE